MPPKKNALGRGFEALFAENTADGLANENAIVQLPINEIEPNRAQPRQVFSDEALAELTESIRIHGVLQPLIVRPMTDGSYQLVAGERRWRAARTAGLTQVPVIVRAFSEEEAAVIALIENLQREDLNAIEAAEGIRKLIDVYGFTQEQAADRIGKSRSAVTNTLRLAGLPEDVRKMVLDNVISAGHARALLSLGSDALISQAAQDVADRHLSVRETEKFVKQQIAAAYKKSPVSKPRDHYYDEVELALSRSMGRRVYVKNAKKGGKLEIEFFDKDDLTRLTKLFDE